MRAHPSLDVLVLCTGNAARSVIAGAALADRRPDLAVGTAGTLVVDGQPMSVRTRAALADVGLAIPRHASRQAHPPEMDAATLVVGLAPEHVEWVRRTHPAAAPRATTLYRLVRDLAPAATLAEQVTALAAHDLPLEDWEEVVDPGGGDEATFIACAREIVELVDALAGRLARPRPMDQSAMAP